ncbi:hypothetical protein [Massilimicrobiota timonensis]|uniref:hypothetical protein n=1 Tax=Massilimicrobiota timonensis TaxID=1776392 RepID=UPI00101D7A96|nr:hypothetical protein [Massilimicrobiota timonensis]
MKKISVEELEGKDLYLDDDGRVIVKDRISNKRFFPEYGETYYYVNIDDFKIKEDTKNNSLFDLLLINKDYAFQTEKEAMEYARYLMVLKKYSHDFSVDEIKDEQVIKYYVYYNSKMDCISINYYYSAVHNKILFKSEEACKNFVKEAGKTNIKRFLFDIWDD